VHWIRSSGVPHFGLWGITLGIGIWTFAGMYIPVGAYYGGEFEVLE